jgi:hypothetical protein
LDVLPPVYSEADLRRLVETLTTLGWTSGQARWRINQAHASWHGFGAAVFGEHLKKWQMRASSRQPHDSEEILYADTCDGGNYALSATLLVDRRRIARHVHLSFELAGVPLDHTPLLQLCRTLGVHTGLYFRPTETDAVQRVTRLQLALGSSDDVVAHVVSDAHLDGADPMVSGVVIANPYWSQGVNAPRLPSLPPELLLISDSEHLICDLRQWHALARRPRQYRLHWIEFTSTSDLFSCRAVADWED